MNAYGMNAYALNDHATGSVTTVAYVQWKRAVPIPRQPDHEHAWDAWPGWETTAWVTEPCDSWSSMAPDRRCPVPALARHPTTTTRTP